jgi:hypothetical protein
LSLPGFELRVVRPNGNSYVLHVACARVVAHIETVRDILAGSQVIRTRCRNDVYIDYTGYFASNGNIRYLQPAMGATTVQDAVAADVVVPH